MIYIIILIVVAIVIWSISKRNAQQDIYLEQAKIFSEEELEELVRDNSIIVSEQLSDPQSCGHSYEDAQKALEKTVIYIDEFNRRNGHPSGPAERIALRVKIIKANKPS